MQLVIVESPTKSKTLQKFLGPKYRVLSSYGHIRDLPEDEFGIEIERDFKPKYIVIPKARKIVRFLKNEIKKTDLVILSLDPDREGEAIAWHLTQILNLNDKKPYQRIVFHEITKSAIEEALKNPRKIDLNLVDAQQTRRILDRIVGYKLSPFLWKKVARRLSAGRVQSVALRLVVEREREIQNFLPQEYWTILAQLKKARDKSLQTLQTLQRSDLCQIEAILVKKDGKVIPKLGIRSKKEAEEIMKSLESAKYKIVNIDKKETKRNPPPPFTTSTLQQDAWQKFKFPAKITIQISQQLFERGFITYHRTDSLNISNLALAKAKKFIIGNYGQNYYQFRKYKTKSKVAQEAHEAIRPTYPDRPHKILKTKLDKNQLKLYELIWRRFIASQMSQAIFDSTVVDIAAKNFIFRATGQMLKFDGFLKIYPTKYKETELPSLKINEILELIKLTPSQHFTQPLPRYTEATLIKALEENGIGRPSTYALILSTIQERNYIEKDEQKRFKPTEIGFVVNDLLVAHFPEIVDIKFTAKMEKDLDKIASGEKKWVSVIRRFYNSFEKNLQKKYQEISKKDITGKPTEKICPKCGTLLLIRLGKFGRFYACSKFPKCKYTEPLEESILGIKCPKCKNGEIVKKRTKRGKFFYGCSIWPKCDFALWDKPTGEKCLKCKSLLIETRRKQVKCSNKECNYRIEK